MQKLCWMALAGFALLVLSGCPGANVTTDYDHQTNFSQFKTFSFAKVETDNPFYEQRIKDEIAKDLQAKGLQIAQSGGDLEVTAVGSAVNKQEYSTFYNGPRFGYYYGGFGTLGGYTTTRVNNYKVGTLVVDMYNGNSRHLVWRGTASRTISGSAGDMTKHLNSAIDQMLQKFPPA